MAHTGQQQPAAWTAHETTRASAPKSHVIRVNLMRCHARDATSCSTPHRHRFHEPTEFRVAACRHPSARPCGEHQGGTHNRDCRSTPAPTPLFLGGGASRWRPGSRGRSAASPLFSTHARLTLAALKHNRELLMARDSRRSACTSDATAGRNKSLLGRLRIPCTPCQWHAMTRSPPATTTSMARAQHCCSHCSRKMTPTCQSTTASSQAQPTAACAPRPK
jgi:hypothetical protein